MKTIRINPSGLKKKNKILEIIVKKNNASNIFPRFLHIINILKVINN